MASYLRPNRYLAPSIRGQRSIDAEEQRMRQQIRREIKMARTKAVFENQKGGKR